jgi:hypothetical protein
MTLLGTEEWGPNSSVFLVFFILVFLGFDFWHIDEVAAMMMH